MSKLINNNKYLDFRKKIMEMSKLIRSRTSNPEILENQDFRIETLRLFFEHDLLLKNMLKFLYGVDINFTSEGYDKIALIDEYEKMKKIIYNSLIDICETIKH